ncbi:MAG: ATP-binding protein [Burkholderiaceae bacterium]|nr:ATP-binding protein [Burkholderiaceae bacterium]
MSRAAKVPGDGAHPSVLWSSLRFYAASRVVLAALFVLYAVLDPAGRFAQGGADGFPQPGLFRALSVAYLFLAAGFLAASLFVRGAFERQRTLQVLADLVMLTLLMHAAGGPASGVGVLLVAAVGAAAVISTWRLAAFFAAAATLLALGESVWRVLDAEQTEFAGFLAAAMIGASCFITATLINRLAARLAFQEALARQRGADLHSQLATTQLVISELPQGVVVFDPQGRVRTMNRSAQALLGAQGPWPALERLVARRLGLDGAAPGQGAASGDAGAAGEEFDFVVDARAQPPAGASHRVRVRFLGLGAAGAPGAPGEADTVLVIEDPRQVEERAQQLKLASMGRLSASIAHEIRNPLAAIRHANGLLAEQLEAAPQQRLASIVEDNSVRIDRIVEDVLSIARRERPTLETVELAQFVPALLGEFVASNAAQGKRIEMDAHEPARMLFDPRHLRLVLVNLLTNALRYASAAPGAVRIEWRRAPDDRLEFRVADDGPGLRPEMLDQAFEPFFTTEARGTGLGLFLAREFCNANQASLRYESIASGARHRAAFVIVARAAPVAGRGAPAADRGAPGE